jgi:hypothetical protein
MDGFSGPPAGPAAQAGFGGSYGGAPAYDAEPNQQIMVRNVSLIAHRCRSSCS